METIHVKHILKFCSRDHITNTAHNKNVTCHTEIVKELMSKIQVVIFKMITCHLIPMAYMFWYVMGLASTTLGLTFGG